MKTTLRVTVIAAASLAAALAFAAPQSQDAAGAAGDNAASRARPLPLRTARLARRLNLSDAQRQQLKANRHVFLTANKPFYDQVRQTRQELRAARQANDTAKLDSLKATLKSQQTQVRQLREQWRAQVISVLTPDQRTQYDQMMARRDARRRGAATN